MKMRISNYIILFLALFIISCDDTVIYKSDFAEEPILYCVLDAENNNQSAIVKRSSADIEDINETYITNAELTLSTNTQEVNLISKEGIESEGPKFFYSTNEFNPIGGTEVTISAKLPNNKILTSTIIPPRFSLFFFDQVEVEIPLPQDQFKTSYKLGWNVRNAINNLAFRAFLFIDYSIMENGLEDTFRVEIPHQYYTQGDITVPIYPSVTENDFQIYYQKVLDQTLKSLSEGDDNKSKYKILGGTLELYILEENLASYFAAAETFRVTYSVKVYENNISNIEGGIGLFGAYIKKTLPVSIRPSYINSLGYTLE